MIVWEFIKRTFGGIGAYLAATGAIVAGVLLLLAGAKKAGRDEQRAQTAEKELDHAKESNAIEERVAVTPPDDRRERLRKYLRD